MQDFVHQPYRNSRSLESRVIKVLQDLYHQPYGCVYVTFAGTKARRASVPVMRWLCSLGP